MTRWTGHDQVIDPGAAKAAGLGTPARHGDALQPGRAAGLALTLLLAAAPALTACSASAQPSASAAGTSAAAISATCTQLGAALADGPDPDADPVGYAEAQIKPLRAIRTADLNLHAAIGDLASAYAEVFVSSGKSAAAASAAAAATRKVSAICPGAAS